MVLILPRHHHMVENTKISRYYKNADSIMSILNKDKLPVKFFYVIFYLL